MMKGFSLMPLLLVVPVALLLSACASVKSTAVFYTPTTSVFYPPKESQEVVPILNETPSRSYTEIGRFAFQTELGYSFVQRALEYNAQRAGADAVIIKKYQSWSVPSYYTVPPVYGWIPVGGYYGGCGRWGGGWYEGGAIPFAYPGYTGVTYQNFIGVDARMIVFRR
jgi:hypothetical protein